MADDRILWCGNLSDKVTEDVLYELFLQAGPLENVHIPKDKDGKQKRFAFITFKHPVSVPYTVALMNGICLYGRALVLNPKTGAKSEPNLYLEKLHQYQQHVAGQVQAPYSAGRRDSYEDGGRQRYDNRRYEPQRWNHFNSPSPYPQYGINASGNYGSASGNHGRYGQNSASHSGYPQSSGGWNRNRR